MTSETLLEKDVLAETVQATEKLGKKNSLSEVSHVYSLKGEVASSGCL